MHGPALGLHRLPRSPRLYGRGFRADPGAARVFGGRKPGCCGLLERRLTRDSHAVIVVAEGAGQDLCNSDGTASTDASGNAKLNDIGIVLRDMILAHCKSRGLEITLKYLDPSYHIQKRARLARGQRVLLVTWPGTRCTPLWPGNTEMLIGAGTAASCTCPCRSPRASASKSTPPVICGRA